MYKRSPQHRDSVQGTIISALVLCVFCSILVSASAVILKPMQVENRLLDRNKNILAAAGLFDPEQHQDSDVNELFAQFTIKLVDFEQGRLLADEEVQQLGLDAEKYNQRKASRDFALSKALNKKQDIAGINRQAKYAPVYILEYKSGENKGQIEKIVLPIHGYGLWGTLYGFVALAGDINTIKGLGFYQHQETPGLGAKVDTPKWKAQWPGKLVYASASEIGGEVAVKLVKGGAKGKHEVDALAGASLTSRGVENLIRYWLGKNGFGPFLRNLAADGSSHRSSTRR